MIGSERACTCEDDAKGGLGDDVLQLGQLFSLEAAKLVDIVQVLVSSAVGEEGVGRRHLHGESGGGR